MIPLSNIRSAVRRCALAPVLANDGASQGVWKAALNLPAIQTSDVLLSRRAVDPTSNQYRCLEIVRQHGEYRPTDVQLGGRLNRTIFSFRLGVVTKPGNTN